MVLLLLLYCFQMCKRQIWEAVADISLSLLKWFELHFLPCNSLNFPMCLCTLSNTICTKVFDEMRMISNSQRTLNVYFHCMTTLSVTCQQCWRSVFTQIQDNAGQSHGHTFWITPLRCTWIGREFGHFHLWQASVGTAMLWWCTVPSLWR